MPTLRDWKPACALVRKDWTMKPNGQAFVDLLTETFTTHATLTTDGHARTRAFFGTYDVRVTTPAGVQTHAVTFTKSTAAPVPVRLNP